MEAFTKRGWTKCRLVRAVRKKKTNEILSLYVQLLPSMNVVKRWPKQVQGDW